MSEQQRSRTDVLRASPPMFESRLLDFFSRVHPAVPVLIFAPAVVVLEAWGLARQGVAAAPGLTLGGYVMGALFEYLVHRRPVPLRPPHGPPPPPARRTT